MVSAAVYILYIVFIFAILYFFVVVYLCYFVQYALDFYVFATVCVFQKRSLCIWSLVVLLYIFTTFLYFMGSCPPQFLVNIGVSLITNTNTTASGSIHKLMKKNNCIYKRKIQSSVRILSLMKSRRSCNMALDIKIHIETNFRM